jgi:FixJ family two-component response regulator
MLLSRNRREAGARDNAIPGLLFAVFAENLASGWISYRSFLIIFISALSAEDAGAHALKTSASRFLKKPFSDERLIDCLDRALRDPAPDPPVSSIGSVW